MSHTTKIINQLRALVLLTQTEEQVARTRISQARTDAVRRELTQNADNAGKRSLEIVEALRSTGGVPDVVTPAFGRASALLKATFEQAAPFEEALFGDLQLEHQLLDRATYLKVLADQAGETAVRQLAEKLVKAHTATVEWLTVVLAEEALGGPAALVPTPLQKVAGGVARAVNAPGPHPQGSAGPVACELSWRRRPLPWPGRPGGSARRSPRWTGPCGSPRSG